MLPLPIVSAVYDSTGVDVTQRRFSSRTSSVAKARRFATGGISDPDLASRVAVVVSELATNAIRHAKSAFLLEVRTDDGGVRVTVSDADPAPPRQIVGGKRSDPTGRGLVIVEALADRWGFHPAGAGKAVWAELDA